MRSMEKFLHFRNLLRPPLLPQILPKRNYPEARKRSYKNVTVAGTQDTFEINLDHRKLKTPSGNILQIPNYPLALAVASEWQSVDKKIIPSWMHLTGLSFTIIDNPQHVSKPDIVSNILEYLPTDTLLFKENSKEDFVKIQSEEWDPIVDWFNKKFDVDVQSSDGICVQNISEETNEKLTRYFSSYNIWAISGILYGVEAIKSVILTAACLERKISTLKAAHLSLLETEWQAEHWGHVEWAHDEDNKN
ncbi:ATP synthase mitochondrial F1 complex assembly factor 2 [Armadillidium nasatum]|uniref:ATP synthase mitochondrial F1 complex assembly factor 2 n=1 Tax=Armadillidium nasatum TaxID=96803 RepID=A0A5N5TNI4_9CRUS|nr:ATP synthase mitochondrial F1 complex assembly factor 2 [Armadillidium nasatum]